ncbi:hypothetical protein [Pandoraea sp. NPDC087047]|uniref:hypothetical protein n=1 Tax=Pandoraea sp. NPDC087047 TaxID=3364390 RepID=UPI00380A467E
MKSLLIYGEAQRFALGRVVATPAALNALADAGAHPVELLNRHAAGDWGEVSDADALLNNRAQASGLRILSCYRLPKSGHRVWIITEADRTATTILLPKDY